MDAPTLRTGIPLRCPKCRQRQLKEAGHQLSCACGFTLAQTQGVYDLTGEVSGEAARQRQTYDQIVLGHESDSDPWHCFTNFDGLKKTRALRRLGLRAGENFLEIGCAAGPILHSLCKNTGARGFGLDISPASVAHQLARRGDAQYDAACAPADELPFAEATFDAVVSLDVLEHVARPEAFIAEVARVLKPRGRALIKCSIADIGLTFDWLQSVLRPAAWKRQQAAIGHFAENFRSKGEHARAATKAGLAVNRIVGGDVFWENVADYVILPRLYAPFTRRAARAEGGTPGPRQLRVPMDAGHRLARLFVRLGEWALWPEWLLGRMGFGASAYFEFEKRLAADNNG